MSFTITCPSCKNTLRAPEELANRRVKCPQCQNLFTVPNPNVISSPSPALAAETGFKAAAETPPAIISSSSRGWRYLSSPWVVMTFLFGFLPWCEVGCNHRDIDIRLTQSGYQALYGAVSAPPALEELLAKESERGMAAQNLPETRQGLHKQLELERSYLANLSPFLVFFWGSCLGLLGIIIFAPLGGWRLAFALPLCGVLLVVLVIHACLGLPFERRAGQVISEAMRKESSGGLVFLAAFKSGKTVWFWLTLASAGFLTVTEPVLNWLRAERWNGWLVPAGITSVATGLVLLGVIVQFALREAVVTGVENRLAQLRQVEEEKRLKVEAENRRRQAEHEADIRKREAEAERLRQQAALKAEEARLEQQRLLREQREQQRRQQEEERRKADEEARERARQREEEAALEKARKAELEKKGLPYYPRPKTKYRERNAEEWTQLARAHLSDYRIQRQAAEALVALKEEGMPFLLEFLDKQTTPAGRDAVLQRIQAEYVHPNDLAQLLPCLERKKALLETRMLALRLLHKRVEHLKDLFPKIEDRVKDLLPASKYRAEVKNILDDIRDKTK